MMTEKEILTALEVAIKPAAARLEKFSHQYTKYVHKYQSCILADLNENRESRVGAGNFTELSADSYEDVEVMLSVLAGWFDRPTQFHSPAFPGGASFPYPPAKVPLCVVEHRDGYVVLATNREGEWVRNTAYAKHHDDRPERGAGVYPLPRWLRMQVGKLKLIPVGTYLGGCGFRAREDMFLVCAKSKKGPVKKGEAT